jgi:hypothetical protein
MRCRVESIFSAVKQWCLSLHLGGAVRSGITLGQLGSYGFNTFFDVFCSAFEVSRSGFNDEILNTEIERKFLRLQTLFGVISRKQLLDERPVDFPDIESRIAFIANDRRPGDVLSLEPDRFACSNSSD